MTTKCPVIGDDRIIEALKVADKMATLLKVLADSKESDELVAKWEILKKDCPYLCTNKQCPCGPSCTCISRCGECNCEKKGSAE
jgi:hypothetical protein